MPASPLRPVSQFRFTDLAKVQDHPAAVVEQQGFRLAAVALSSYERDHKVTFAALDNDALAAVREAYGRVANTSRSDLVDHHRALESLYEAISPLLGLDD